MGARGRHAGPGASLPDQLSESFELSDLLARIIEYGVSRLQCASGAAYLYDAATGGFDRYTSCQHADADHPGSLGQQTVRRAFRTGKVTLAPARAKRRLRGRNGIGADLAGFLVAIPLARRFPAAVFCFVFDESHRIAVTENGVSPETQAAVDHLADELRRRDVGDLVRLHRILDSTARIRSAGAELGQLRSRVSDFLSAVGDRFKATGMPPPDLSWFQIVDARRNTIRTLQGRGLAINFNSLVSHSLDSSDVQAEVVRSAQARLIVGNHQRLFDQTVFSTYGHHDFVRLWVPMFPLPRSLESGAPNRDELLRRWVRWEMEVLDDDEAQSLVGRWDEEVHAAPPPSLIYGTLEVGYRRQRHDSLEFAPLTRELASWTVAQAWTLGTGLFGSTLPGALETVGHASATAAGEGVDLTVAMPDWRTPEVRKYPIDGQWPVAIPLRDDAGALSLPAQAGTLTFPNRAPAATGGAKGARGLCPAIRTVAEEAIQLIFRLDDHAADPYLLITDTEDRAYVGTAVPDPRLEPLLREICRECASEECTFLEVGALPGSEAAVDMEEIWAFRVTRVDSHVIVPRQELLRQVLRVVAHGAIWSGTLPGVGQQVATILPLALADDTHAALILMHRGAALAQAEMNNIESRVTLWTHRLSLRRLVVRDRFSTLIRHQRERIRAALDAAQEKGTTGYLDAFMKALFSKINTQGAVIVLYSQSPSGPDMVRRFWGTPGADGRGLTVDTNTFIGSPPTSPSRKALAEKRLIVYRPSDQRRQQETEPINQELLLRAREMRQRGEDDRASALARIVALARGDSTTMLVAPLTSPRHRPIGVEGAVSVFLEGAHRFDAIQRQLILELARVAAESIAEMLQLDQGFFERLHSTHLDRLRNLFAMASTEDDVVGHLFAGMGRSRSSQPGNAGMRGGDAAADAWNLADDAVFWILDHENRELVVRSARGMGLAALQEILVIDPSLHPLLAQVAPRLPRKERPRVPEFQLWTFELGATENPVCSAYRAVNDTRWLLSFAVQDATGRIIGVIDCLREQPLAPEEEQALKIVLRRLAMWFVAALERTRQRSAIAFARRLTIAIMNELSELRVESAYRRLVELARDEMECEQCDLFLERDGKLLLHSTTRAGGPRTIRERYDFCIAVESASSALFPGHRGLHRRPAIFHGSRQASPASGLVGPLAALLAEDHQFERLVLPLQLREALPGDTDGYLQFRGPIATRVAAGHLVKKSGVLTRAHLRKARDCVVVIQRLVTMTGLVDRQEWLVNELQHDIGQPLQAMRKAADDALRALVARGATHGELISLRLRLDHSAELVQAIRDRLAAFSKLGQALEPVLETTDLVRLLEACCTFKEPEAKRRGCHITWRTSRRHSYLVVDVTWLRLAFLNLIDNAIKYSYANREIEVGLHEEGGGARVVVTIGDYGIGIPSRDRERIFDPYFRSLVPDVKGARHGSGIGLAIVRHAVQQIHGGEVTVESNPAYATPIGETADQIANIPHKTVFTILLPRADTLRRERVGRGEHQR